MSYHRPIQLESLLYILKVLRSKGSKLKAATGILG